MKKILKFALVISFIAIIATPLQATNAKVLWRDGPNYVSNAGEPQLLCTGLMHLAANNPAIENSKYLDENVVTFTYRNERGEYTIGAKTESSMSIM